MSTNGKKLVLSVDQAPGFGGRGHQISLGLFDADGRGGGFRLYGPKYAGNSKTLIETELNAGDRQRIRQYLDAVDGPLTVSDEAVEAAAKLACTAVVQIEGDDPEEYLAWDECSEDDREKMRKLARVIIEAALPLLKYEASS